MVKINWAYLLGFAGVYSFNVLFIAMFISAWLSPTKTLLMDINHYGEADFELFGLAILSLCMMTTWFPAAIKHFVRDVIIE